MVSSGILLVISLTACLLGALGWSVCFFVFAVCFCYPVVYVSSFLVVLFLLVFVVFCGPVSV